MKTKILLLVLVVMTVFGNAKASVREAWLMMPDSLLPYLNKNQRLELLELRDMKVKAEVKNLLNGNTVMDTLTTNYLSLTLSPSSSMQMKVLPGADGDSVICVVRTFSGPAAESTVELYRSDWTLQRTLPLAQEGVDAFVSKPDTMNLTKFNELKAFLKPLLVAATLSPSEDSLSLEVSVPLASKADRKAVEAILLQRKVNWTGSMFK